MTAFERRGEIDRDPHGPTPTNVKFVRANERCRAPRTSHRQGTRSLSQNRCENDLRLRPARLDSLRPHPNEPAISETGSTGVACEAKLPASARGQRKWKKASSNRSLAAGLTAAARSAQAGVLCRLRVPGISALSQGTRGRARIARCEHRCQHAAIAWRRCPGSGASTNGRDSITRKFDKSATVFKLGIAIYHYVVYENIC